MAKKEKNAFTLKFLMETEKWQEDCFNHWFEEIGRIQNDMNKKMYRIYHDMIVRKKYKEVEKKKEDRYAYIYQFTIPSVYKKRTEEKLKDGTSIWHQKGDIKNNQIFSELGFRSYISKFSPSYVDGFLKNSLLLQSISMKCWASWEKFLFGKGDKINTHQSVDSFLFGYNSGNKKFTGFEIDKLRNEGKIGIYFKKVKRIPHYINIKINRNSEYELFALNCPIKNIGIQRRLIRGKYKYYLLLNFQGIAYGKGRELGKGRVGLDVGVSTIAAVSNTNVILEELSKGVNFNMKKIAKLDRLMDASRRSTNPCMYNEDGTIKSFEKGEKKPRWIYSKRYLSYRNKRNDLFRKVTDARNISHNILANQICELGNEFIVEDNKFKALQRRAKETKYDNYGKAKSKKRFGKSLLSHAPASLVSKIEYKSKWLGGKFYKVDCKNAATQFDFTNQTFEPHKLSVRKVVLSDGKSHQRDIMAAFNLQHLANPSAAMSIEEKSAKHYDVKSMFQDYPRFSALEKKLIEDKKAMHIKHPSSFGI